jgi:hypothetical protein
MAASTKLTPEQRTLRARLAALSRWAAEDPTANAERGQRGLRAKFTREVAAQFPDLPEAELARRAEAAYRAHMVRLALSKSKARAAAAA